jgi:hypothetical protein
MRDLVDLMLRVRAGASVFEAANVRHEHEYHIWEDQKLPDVMPSGIPIAVEAACARYAGLSMVERGRLCGQATREFLSNRRLAMGGSRVALTL